MVEAAVTSREGGQGGQLSEFGRLRLHSSKYWPSSLKKPKAAKGYHGVCEGGQINLNWAAFGGCIVAMFAQMVGGAKFTIELG